MANQDRPRAGGPQTGQKGGITDEQRAQRRESHRAGTYRPFIRELANVGGFSEEDAECYAVSVLCALEQRLMGDEVKDLESQLPYTLRELLQRCPHHEGAPPRKLNREQFLRLIAEDLQKEVDAVEPIVRAVFGAVRARITEGEAEDVAAQLPKDLQELWMRPI